MRKCIFTLLAISVFYNVWSQTPLKAGDKAPQFSGVDNNDKKLNLKSLLKDHNTLVVFFYRGQWDTYCIKQVKNIQDSLNLITGKGARVIAVTPETDLGVITTISKTGASFSIIHDIQYKIMKAFGVNLTVDDATLALMKKYRIDMDVNNGNNDHVLPVPATFIIDKKLKIKNVFFDPNYKHRASVQQIVAAL
ncbi:redoxin domain-containing protein [Mucilaginibacter sp. AW1-3]